jgi:hypothetical protein
MASTYQTMPRNSGQLYDEFRHDTRERRIAFGLATLAALIAAIMIVLYALGWK